jgi:hypothetical protein
MPDNPLIVKRQIKGCVNSPGQPFKQPMFAQSLMPSGRSEIARSLRENH